MAQALLLEGAAVRPARLLAAGFGWQHPDLEAAFRDQLRR
jgi:NAD dependent epimerase/dehydratase family enzyme